MMKLTIILLYNVVFSFADFNRYLCESNVIDGNDPTIQSRSGRLFEDGDCKLMNINDESSESESSDDIDNTIDLNNDLTPCISAPRRRAPGCDSYWIFESGENYDAEATAMDRFAVPFFPGGPGIGGSPFRDPSDLIAWYVLLYK